MIQIYFCVYKTFTQFKIKTLFKKQYSEKTNFYIFYLYCFHPTYMSNCFYSVFSFFSFHYLDHSLSIFQETSLPFICSIVFLFSNLLIVLLYLIFSFFCFIDFFTLSVRYLIYFHAFAFINFNIEVSLSIISVIWGYFVCLIFFHLMESFKMSSIFSSLLCSLLIMQLVLSNGLQEVMCLIFG